MTFKSAAEKVLEQTKQPLHFKKITERALKQGLIHCLFLEKLLTILANASATRSMFD